MATSLNIVYFAWVRERIGLNHENLSMGAALTVNDVLNVLSDHSEAHRAVFSEPEKLRFALDMNFVAGNTAIGEAKELAIFPPVTGG